MSKRKHQPFGQLFSFSNRLLGFHGTSGFIAVKGKPSSGLIVEIAGVFISASEDSGEVRVYSPKHDVELAVGESRSGGVILIHDELKFPPRVESPFPRVVIGGE